MHACCSSTGVVDLPHVMFASLSVGGQWRTSSEGAPSVVWTWFMHAISCLRAFGAAYSLPTVLCSLSARVQHFLLAGFAYVLASLTFWSFVQPTLVRMRRYVCPSREPGWHEHVDSPGVEEAAGESVRQWLGSLMGDAAGSLPFEAKYAARFEEHYGTLQETKEAQVIRSDTPHE